MGSEPERFCQAAGVLLLLMAAAGLGVVVLDSAFRPCRSCTVNAAYVRALALDQMSWVPAGRPTRYPLAGAERRFDPLLPLPAQDPANVVFPLSFFQETTHAAMD
ncbi:MAG: hypothetical protein MUC46_03755 [Desulfobacterales bacterium]|nr:hypothetical protein [Desulfobacterales bacterium]